MQGLKGEPTVDVELLRRFQAEVRDQIPHWEGGRVVKETPLIEITDILRECARVEYGLEISAVDFKVFGKLESSILTGSVKVRPAAQIIENAISTGKLTRRKTIFEATSGNFGIALGLLAKLDLNVVALVSRKLQEGVFEDLRNEKVNTIDLDMDICPAPGMELESNIIAAKSMATNIRHQLAEAGLSPTIFDKSRAEIERLLAKQDVINLAKFLAQVYDGFCPEQYDNEENVKAHEVITGPEIDQQVRELGFSLGDFRLVSTFGTGGTSGGLSRHLLQKHGKKSVHVVFPLRDQDVAGIRTKDKALGLRFYEPERYAGQHETDFEPAKRLLRFFVSKGYDIGESSALALYAVLQMVNYGTWNRFVVVLADGIEKYKKSLEIKPPAGKRLEVTVQEAASNPANYVAVLWTHTAFTPREEGIKLIEQSIGRHTGEVKVVRSQDVERFLGTGEVPEAFGKLLPRSGRILLVCLAGGTSLRVAQLLSKKGTEAQSLTGGIIGLSSTTGRHPAQLVQPAKA
jgi:cysteine synthase/rhodanese-related sulfurtransferase